MTSPERLYLVFRVDSLNEEQRLIYELNADSKAFIADVLASKNIVYLTTNGKNTAVLLDIQKYDALIHGL
jgi:hypothetical protein